MTLDSVVCPQVLNKYSILVDVKRERFKYQSGRFKYQSGRAGDEAKKHKSPARSRRVGIYEFLRSKASGKGQYIFSVSQSLTCSIS